MEQGVDINKKNKQGNNPLDFACVSEKITIVKYLIEHGAKISKFILFCAMNGAIAKYLIECGADVNVEDGEGETPIFGACRNLDIEMVRVLAENGANVNKRNKDDKNPLNIVNYYGYRERRDPAIADSIIDCLTKHGARY